MFRQDAPDCNSNNIGDFCDIYDCGPSDPDCADCNSNEIPDECDIAGSSEDCDSNSVPDECQGGPIAACCLPDSSCIMTFEACCDAQSGTFAENFTCFSRAPPYVTCG